MARRKSINDIQTQATRIIRRSGSNITNAFQTRGLTDRQRRVLNTASRYMTNIRNSDAYNQYALRGIYDSSILRNERVPRSVYMGLNQS